MTAIQAPAFPQNPSASDVSLTSGEAVYGRNIGSNVVTLQTGTMALSYFTAQRTENAAFVTTLTNSTAANLLTYAAVGVYSVDSAGNLTKITDTGDLHATLWIATFSQYVSALSPAFTKQAGQRYAIGLLAVGTTPPNLPGAGNNSSNLLIAPPVAIGEVTGQSALPASVATGSITHGAVYFNLIQAILSLTSTP